MFDSKGKPYPIKDQLNPGKNQTPGGDFWNDRRNATYPTTIVSPDKNTPKSWVLYSEDAWQILFKWRPNNANNSNAILTFTNGTTINLHDFGNKKGDVAELLLDGQPYIKRSDIVEITITDGSLYIFRDVITLNTEKPTK
jgi:hypothetical protein